SSVGVPTSAATDTETRAAAAAAIHYSSTTFSAKPCSVICEKLHSVLAPARSAGVQFLTFCAGTFDCVFVFSPLSPGWFPNCVAVCAQSCHYVSLLCVCVDTLWVAVQRSTPTANDDVHLRLAFADRN